MKYVGAAVIALVACTSVDARAVSAAPTAANLAPVGPPSYRLAQVCRPNEPVLEIVVTLHNAGGTASAAVADSHAVVVRDQDLLAWTGGAALPAIASGATVPITVSLRAFSKPEAMSGTRHFAATVNLTPVGSVAVTFPPSYCNSAQGVRSAPVAVASTPEPRSKTDNNAVPHAYTGQTYTAAPLPPLNLRQPPSLGDCRSHGGMAGGLVCLAAYGNDASGLPLIWDAYNSSVDGFRLYRVDGGRRPISPQIGANGAGVTLGYVPGPSNSFNGQCYVVTAYRGSSESSDSKVFCVSGKVAGVNVTLNPAHAAANIKHAGGTTGAFRTVLTTLIDPAGLLGTLLQTSGNGWENGTPLVGYEYRTNKGAAGDSFYNMYARGALHFDITPFHQRYVTSATLRLIVDYAYGCRGNTPCKTQSSCAVAVAPATQLWWDLTGDLSGVDMANAVNQTVAAGPIVLLDVTKIVRAWADGGKNYGFVLIGPNENLGAFTEDSCFSKYQSESLNVSYF